LFSISRLFWITQLSDIKFYFGYGHFNNLQQHDLFFWPAVTPEETLTVMALSAVSLWTRIMGVARSILAGWWWETVTELDVHGSGTPAAGLHSPTSSSPAGPLGSTGTWEELVGEN
jgi:hypothetical protein